MHTARLEKEEILVVSQLAAQLLQAKVGESIIPLLDIRFASLGDDGVHHLRAYDIPFLVYNTNDIFLPIPHFSEPSGKSAPEYSGEVTTLAHIVGEAVDILMRKKKTEGGEFELHQDDYRLLICETVERVNGLRGEERVVPDTRLSETLDIHLAIIGLRVRNIREGLLIDAVDCFHSTSEEHTWSTDSIDDKLQAYARLH